MTSLLLALSVAFGLPRTVVNDPIAGEPDPETVFQGIRNVAGAIAKALADQPDLATRRELLIELELTKKHYDPLLRSGELGIAAWAYLLDLEGADVDPLERLLFLAKCATASRVETHRYVLCHEDWSKLVDDEVRAALARRTLDPVLAHVARGWVDKTLGDVRRKFDATEARMAADPHLQALRAAAIEASSRWEAAYQDQQAAFERARPAETSWVLGIAPSESMGCEEPEAVSSLLSARLATVVRGARSDAAHDPAAAALLRAMALCARRAGDFATVYAIDSVFAADDEVVRGPRTLARTLALIADAGQRRMDGAGESGGTSSSQVIRQGEDDQRIASVRGRIASLEVAGDATRIKLKSEKVPELRYSCQGSGRITGIYQLGNGFGVSRDMSCGYEKVGTIIVPGGEVTVPTVQLPGVVKGDYVVVYSNREGAAPARLVWAAKDDTERALHAMLGFATPAFGTE